MPDRFRVAMIGCGGMAGLHVEGYKRRADCEMVAVVDVNGDKAQAFAAAHAPGAKVYEDYKKMLRKERPTAVSICLWTALHEPAVNACARAGAKVIHCEKPMAPTWGEALKMVATCDKHGAQLTFGHQRRFLPVFRLAKKLAHDGTIGSLIRLEAVCDNMIDWGTHWLDMMFFFNHETPAVWVLGQIDARQWHEVYGLPYEHQAICEVRFQNDVRGILFTGEDHDVGATWRLYGTGGVIELNHHAPHLRVRGQGDRDWCYPAVEGGLHGGEAVAQGVEDALDSYLSQREPELSARRALRATEVIFATYESSRRRGRVDLPLKQRDSAYLTMVKEGTLKPRR